MESIREIKITFLIRGPVIVFMFLFACMMGPHNFTQGKKIEKNMVEKIKVGKTTKGFITNIF